MTNLLCLSYYVLLACVLSLDRDSAVVAEVEFAIMHDGCVIISITVGVDLTSFVFVKIEQLASVDIAHMDNDVIVSVITVLFVMQTCMRY